METDFDKLWRLTLREMAIRFIPIGYLEDVRLLCVIAHQTGIVSQAQEELDEIRKKIDDLEGK